MSAAEPTREDVERRLTYLRKVARSMVGIKPDEKTGFVTMPPSSFAQLREDILQAVEMISAIAAMPATVDVPEGWVLVPREPTVEMVVSATEDWMCIRAVEDRAEAIWSAMLAAAPSPLAEEAE